VDQKNASIDVSASAGFRPPPGLGKPVQTNLRVDAQPFVPQYQDDNESVIETREPWEAFLDEKKAVMAEQAKYQFRRLGDGTYTGQYRGMLVQPWKPPRGKFEKGKSEFDLIRSWRDSRPEKKEVKPEMESKKKRKSTPLKKAILAQRAADPPSELWMKFDQHLQKFNSEKAPPPASAPIFDDMAGLGRAHPPFGLSDRCFHTDIEDKKRSSRHRAPNPVPVREYVTTEITPELETAVTDTLFHLRRLKKQEKGLGLPGRRYAVGFREVARLVSQKKLAALLVAPDVERTSGGALEQAIAKIVADCESNAIPVVYALSRRQLGQAIQKNVAISVFAFQDVRGAEESFNRMLALAAKSEEE
jgi:ribosomal protein L7Ae-like RNA K-turn-binding protein